MSTYAFVAPVLPGKLPAAKEMTSLMLGDRRREAEELRRTAGLDREQVFIHTTPMGEFAIVVWDTDDIDRVFETFATDKSEMALWFRGKLKEIHGFDLADPTNPAPKPEVIGEWKSTNWSWDGFEATALCFPVQAGKSDAARGFVKSMLQGGSHYDQFVQSREEFGVVRQIFTLLATPSGDVVAIMYGEGKPGWFKRLFEANATSQDPFYAWFREGMMSWVGAPIFDNPTTPKTEQVFNMTTRVPANV